MYENTQNCIQNCFKTTLGTHTLYRDFGMSLIDEVNIPTRKDILIQLSTFYPDISIDNVQVVQVNKEGEFYYTINLSNNNT